MDAIEIILDGGVFSADSVVRAAHRYSADYYTDIASSHEAFIVRLTPKSANADTTDLPNLFRNDALDEQLRERVRAQTQELQNTLIHAALINSGQRPPDPSR